MATNLLPIQPIGVTASLPRSTDNLRRRSTVVAAAANGGASSWWSPLFGWSSEADYIDSKNNEDIKDESMMKMEKKSKFRPGCFTEEKARRLRMMTTETETFHEVMYHSAIAARLATDFSRRSD